MNFHDSLIKSVLELGDKHPHDPKNTSEKLFDIDPELAPEWLWVGCSGKKSKFGTTPILTVNSSFWSLENFKQHIENSE